MRNEQPGVKYTTDGRAGWTPISIRNRFSTRSDEYDVKYLRQCVSRSEYTTMKRLVGELALNLDPPYFQHQLQLEPVLELVEM